MQHVLDLGSVHASRSNFDGDTAGAKGLDLETIFRQFIRDFREDGLLSGRECQDNRHQQTLALNTPGRALFQDSFKQHTFVGHMLVNDPEALVIDGKDKRLSDLAQRLERTQRGSELAGDFRFVGKCGSTGVVGNDLSSAGQ